MDKEKQDSTPPSNRRSYTIGMVFTLMSAVLWGSTYPVIKIALNYYNAYDISLYRALFATLSLSFYMVIARKEMLPKKEELPLFLLGAILGAAGFWTLLNAAVLFLAADAASFLVALYPLFAVILATVILHERMSVFAGVGVLLGIIGTFLIVSFGEGAGLTGNQPIFGAMLAFMAALSWAGYMITTRILVSRKRKSGKLVGPEYATFNNFLLAIPISLVFTIISGSGTNFLAFSPAGLAYMAYLGILTSGVAFLIFNIGIKLIGVTAAAVNQLVFPAVAVIISYFALGETVNIPELAGMGLIIAGIAMAQLLSRR